jgi:hypothetical protein
MEKKPLFNLGPIDISEKGVYVISSFKTIIDHKGVFKDIHD